MRKICIDDFALRKGQRYGTIMIDIETSRTVDILESRETADVAAWLKTYPNIKVVSRDGAITYAKAITESHPKAIQVSDRFHLLKNLTDAAKSRITSLLGSKFRIKASNEKVNSDGSYFNTAIELAADLPERIHNASTKKKQAVVDRVRELARNGYSTSAIAKETGKSYGTVKKYSNENFNPASVIYGDKLNSKLKAHTQEIDAMLRKGHQFKEILAALRLKGYDGAISTLKMYATRERRLMKAATEKSLENTELLERKWITKLLYHSLEKVSEITQEQLRRVVREYPVIGNILDIVHDFKDILSSKRVRKLKGWMKRALLLGVDEIDSFVNGISRDLAAVKNAILLDYSNGLAEGSVNRLKVIKRIMYGRCSFSLLRNKLLPTDFLSFN